METVFAPEFRQFYKHEFAPPKYFTRYWRL